MTIVNEMPVDHGLTVPLSVTCGQPDEWPFKVIPLCGERDPVSAADRRALLQARPGHSPRGRGISRDLRVVVFGTGGMSHQLQGERAGFVNQEFDTMFLDGMVNDPRAAHQDFSHRSTCARRAPKASRW